SGFEHEAGEGRHVGFGRSFLLGGRRTGQESGTLQQVGEIRIEEILAHQFKAMVAAVADRLVPPLSDMLRSPFNDIAIVASALKFIVAFAARFICDCRLMSPAVDCTSTFIALMVMPLV